MWFGTLWEGSVEKRMHEVIQRTGRTWLGREKKGILRESGGWGKEHRNDSVMYRKQ